MSCSVDPWKLDEQDDPLACVQGAFACKRQERPVSESRLSDLTHRSVSSFDFTERGQAIAAACVVASICGSWDRVLSFVSEGNADLEQLYQGRTALMIAAEHSDALPVLDLLISRGASCTFVG